MSVWFILSSHACITPFSVSLVVLKNLSISAYLQRLAGGLKAAVLRSACFPTDSYLVWVGGNVQTHPCLLVQSQVSMIYSQQGLRHASSYQNINKKITPVINYICCYGNERSRFTLSKLFCLFQSVLQCRQKYWND